MTRETRFGLFLAAMMLLSLGVAASADTKPDFARSGVNRTERVTR
jgi:hypothetical protein